MHAITLSLAAILMLSVGGAALAAPPTEGERPGRYIMQTVDGGFLRMDTETGAMSMCLKRGATFACDAVADERTASKEVDRLAIENRELKAEIKRLEHLLGLGEAAPKGDKHARRGPKFELPSEDEVDKALSYFDRMLKKFRERMKDFESGGKATPL